MLMHKSVHFEKREERGGRSHLRKVNLNFAFVEFGLF